MAAGGQLCRKEEEERALGAEENCSAQEANGTLSAALMSTQPGAASGWFPAGAGARQLGARQGWQQRTCGGGTSWFELCPELGDVPCRVPAIPSL